MLLQEDDMHELIDDTGEDIPDAADLMKMRHRDVELGKLDDEINPEELQQYLDQRFGGRAYAPGKHMVCGKRAPHSPHVTWP